MQVVGALIRHNYKGERLDELKKEVSRMLAHLKHLHQAQIFVVHLVLDVDAEDGLH